ncbi:hypothetical protein EJ04DRAFT_93859 [Polyplosphaeria fusca]|uniref:Uncharacterized protein n=1 Tax=Polyplosphaeria fusca TaxID=682080 RepID=A0A9P4R1E0_9PLEO|nr:hypothetical protein EJ04DRAFT_93859 [Polyplosphaeria fusca]
MSIAALTTIFTPPASCIASENIWWIWKSTALDTTTQSLIWHQLGPPSASDCFPPSYTPGSTAYYTPGRCPSGYTAAQTIVSSAGTVTETVQTCCPAPYRFRARETDAVISNGFEYQSELLCWSQFQGATSMPITKSSAGTAEQEDFSFGTDATLHAYGVVV